ncbi:MAG: winged helix-turn-helix domain-containing protein [Pseudomonadota bacterium]
MKHGPDIARIAALIGDPARANILTALVSGKSLTATELSIEAGVTLQTTSSHLKKLEEGGLVQQRKQGRHKYFSLADDETAHVLEGLMGLAAGRGQLRTRTGPKDDSLRYARVCYNHLAGEMGVLLYDRFKARKFLEVDYTGLTLSDDGRQFVSEFGIDLVKLDRSKTPLCRECLDWSERRSHLAGSLGRALLKHFEGLGWAKRNDNSRAITFTRFGDQELRRLLQS